MGDKRLVEPPFEISLFMCEPSTIPDVIRVFAGMVQTQLGPGFCIKRAMAREDTKSRLSQISIWDTWTFYASILAR